MEKDLSLRIETKAAPDDADFQAIVAPLRAYNHAQAGLALAEKVAFLVNDESGVTHGGLHARVFGQWLFIELLVVPEVARGEGMGTKLMNMAEATAREKGCVGIWLDTFSFQAPDFYQRLGYSVFGELKDYPPGHSRYFMQKRLDL
jgi:predicted N-acetyltransferase YhbS